MRIPAAKHWPASPAPEGAPRFAHERQGGSGEADAASASPPDEAGLDHIVVGARIESLDAV